MEKLTVMSTASQEIQFCHHEQKMQIYLKSLYLMQNHAMAVEQRIHKNILDLIKAIENPNDGTIPI